MSVSGDVDHLISALADVLAHEPRVVAAYLFGSVSEGTATHVSDVDVGVLCSEHMALRDLVELEGRLESAAERSVDLLDLRRAGAFVALDVVRGRRFFCRNELAADEFDLYVLRRAGDLEPFERERRAFFLSGAG